MRSAPLHAVLYLQCFSPNVKIWPKEKRGTVFLISVGSTFLAKIRKTVLYILEANFWISFGRFYASIQGACQTVVVYRP